MRSFLAGAALLLLGSALAAPASTLTVTVLYPANQLGGQGLYIRGNATALSWSVGLELTPVATDEYAISLPLSSGDAAGPLAVKLLVADETWQVGANELIAIPSPAGNFSYTAYPWFGSQPGRYETVDGLYSPQLNNTRGLCVYLPPSYDENPYKPFYPEDVLWMHDGQNLFNESTAPFGAWMIQDTLDPMITNALMREIIVVGVDNTDQRTYEYTYSVDPTVGVGGGADLYLDFLEQNVLPFVLTRYRISATGRTRVAAAATPTGATRAATGRAGAELAATGCEEGLSRWGMLGSSLGGLLSCYAAWTRPDMWGAFAGCMSSSFWWNSEDFNNTIMQRHAGGAYPPYISVYLDSGNAGPDDDDVNQTQTVRDHMLAMGFAYSNDSWASPASERELGYYLDQGGQHNEKYWGARFHVPMAFAYQPLVHEALMADAPSCLRTRPASAANAAPTGGR